MLKHYLITTFRNLRKHTLQNVISVTGLAIGFTFFALSSLWFRYELTYDSFHKDADRIYILSQQDAETQLGRTFSTPSKLGEYLVQNLPEVEEAGYAYGYQMDYTVDNEAVNLFHLTANEGFLRMFNIDILQESGDFKNPDKHEVAITKQAAERIFHTDHPVGKQLDRYGRKTNIGALVEGWSKHSLNPFDLITINNKSSWTDNSTTYLKLSKDTDLESFEKKLGSFTVEGEERTLSGFQITPMSSYRYSKYYQYTVSGVKFQHVFYFVLLGLLVILCALFNYITLYITNLRMRGKEMALRKINGSGNYNLLALLSFELVVILIISMFLGFVLIEILFPYFTGVAGIMMTKTAFYYEAFLYMFVVIMVSFLASLIPVHYFRKRTLRESLDNIPVFRNRNLFRKISIVTQLTITLLLIFCTLVMIKQLSYLNQTDGISRENTASINVWSNFDKEELYKYISGLPMVTEVLPMNYFSIIPDAVRVSSEIEEWDENQTGKDKIFLNYILGDKRYAEFYSLNLLQGKMIDDTSLPGDALINETALKSFGWENPLGKKFGEGRYTVVGVIQDFQINSPTMQMPDIAIISPRDEKDLLWRSDILFRYEEDTWNECKKEIETFIRNHYPTARLFVNNTQERYDTLLQSEAILLKLLTFISLVCILICIFGIYSFVTLTCEQRRKEIAIRKVNGAVVGNILTIFIKEYTLLLLPAAFIAFTLGYSVMKPWVETYVRQTGIGFNMYLSIFLGVFFVIMISILQPVLKVIRQNPAEVLKSE